MRPETVLSMLIAAGGRDAELTIRGRALDTGVAANGIEMMFSMFRAVFVTLGIGMLAERLCLEVIFKVVESVRGC